MPSAPNWVNGYVWAPVAYTDAQRAAVARALGEPGAVDRVAAVVGRYVAARENERDRPARAAVADELEAILRALRRGERPADPTLAARTACAALLTTAIDFIAFRRITADPEAQAWARERLPAIVRTLRAPGREHEGAARELFVGLALIWREFSTHPARFAYDPQAMRATGPFARFVRAALAGVDRPPSLARIAKRISQAIEAAQSSGTN